jgi:hypothetical protein
MQSARREQIDANTEKGLNLDLQSCRIHQACPRPRIDQNIQIALLVILPTRDRPEDAWIRHPSLDHKLANLFAV